MKYEIFQSNKKILPTELHRNSSVINLSSFIYESISGKIAVIEIKFRSLENRTKVGFDSPKYGYIKALWTSPAEYFTKSWKYKFSLGHEQRFQGETVIVVVTMQY